ncbi:MAG: hypothetical protein AAB909_04635 [Patescibacteria group bacterium]
MLTDNDIQRIKDALKPDFDQLYEQLNSSINDLESRTSRGFKRTEERLVRIEAKIDDSIQKHESGRHTFA